MEIDKKRIEMLRGALESFRDDPPTTWNMTKDIAVIALNADDALAEQDTSEVAMLKKRVKLLRDAIYRLQDDMPTKVFTGDVLRKDRKLAEQGEH